ncbi:hypothetical protein TWF694_007259 [Orbilia ellipsospora]|uniref:Uncharacterized protein n=1 Tax=Orbilia ellipsospora TaxID=2528407 RepID=A0AAV9XH69_9PEZI
MWLKTYILILIYSTFTNSAPRPLDDDSDWNRNKAITILSSLVKGVDNFYQWSGVIKSMFFDDKNRCLTVDMRNQNFGRPHQYARAVVNHCPDSRDAAPTEQRWFVKGTIEFIYGDQPVFEGYIRSNMKTWENEQLCLTAHKDIQQAPGLNPTYNAYVDAQDIPENTAWGAKVLQYRNFITHWGPAYLDTCNINNPNQVWHIGLGKSNLPNAPDKWTWIRPKSYPPGTCRSPQDKDWCDGTDHTNCRPNYPFNRGLMRPNWQATTKDDGFTLLTEVGCSPSLWMFQPNFIALDNNGNILNAIVSGTQQDSRHAPYYLDSDIVQPGDAASDL